MSRSLLSGLQRPRGLASYCVRTKVADGRNMFVNLAQYALVVFIQVGGVVLSESHQAIRAHLCAEDEVVRDPIGGVFSLGHTFNDAQIACDFFVNECVQSSVEVRVDASVSQFNPGWAQCVGAFSKNSVHRISGVKQKV